MVDAVRWLDRYPKCSECGKVAHGVLRGLRNDSYGAYCTRCADRRLKLAEKERTAEVRRLKEALVNQRNGYFK